MGYRDIEFDEPPKGWHVSELNELVEIHNTKRQPLNSQERLNRKGVFPYCGANGIVDHIDDYKYDGEFVLIAEDGGYWGKNESTSYIMRGKFWVNNHAHVVRARDGVTTNEYLNYVINYLNILPFIGGDARGKLTKAVLQEIDVPYPSLQEQKRVAHVLNTVQEAISHQERLIQTTYELKQTLMKKLFTEGLRGEAQKETEIGLVPESWEVVRLGDFCQRPKGFIQTGPFGSQLHSHEYTAEGIPVVNPTHLNGNRINHEDVPRVPRDVADRLSRHYVRTGDILFARRGDIGRHGLVGTGENEWLCGTGCFLVRVNHDDIDNQYLSYYISTTSVVNWLKSHAMGAIMPNLNTSVIAKLPICVPTIEDQKRIVELFSSIEQKLSQNQKKRDQLQDLFRTLLHELMTGKTRVHRLEFS